MCVLWPKLDAADTLLTRCQFYSTSFFFYHLSLDEFLCHCWKRKLKNARSPNFIPYPYLQLCHVRRTRWYRTANQCVFELPQSVDEWRITGKHPRNWHVPHRRLSHHHQKSHYYDQLQYKRGGCFTHSDDWGSRRFHLLKLNQRGVAWKCAVFGFTFTGENYSVR